MRPQRPAPTAAPAASRSDFRPDPGAIAKRAGRYVVRGQLTDVTNGGDHLEIKLEGTDLDLIPIAPDRFVPEKRSFLGLFRFSLSPIEVEFADVAGHSVAVLRGLPAPVPCERVDPGPIPPAWRARLGTYAPEDLSGERFVIRDLRVEEDAGILVARVRLSGTTPDDPATEARVALRPVSDDEAVVVGAGATVRALSRPTGDALRYSGFTFVAAAR